MKVQDVLDEFENVRIAARDDNQKILDFYDSIDMEGGAFKVRFAKNPDYFKFLKYEAANYLVFSFEDDEGNMEGMGSLTIRPCYLNGKIEYIGHFSDLRFKRKKDRKSGTSWKDIAGGIIKNGKDIAELDKCKYYLGSYMEANVFAKKAIGTDKSAKKKDAKAPEEPQKEMTPEEQKEALEKLAKAMAAMPFGVSNVSSYQMVSIVARRLKKFIFKKKVPTKSGLQVSISIGQDSDIDELKDFLDKQNRVKAFGYVYNGKHDELGRRFRDWDDFSVSNFYLARSSSGKLLACFATWNPTKGRRIVVDRFPTSLAIMGKIVRIFGKKVPKVGSELETLYITNLEIEQSLTLEDKRYILNKLLEAVYATGIMKKYHILAFCDYFKESLIEDLDKYYMTEKTKTTLYQLHQPDSTDVVKEAELEYPPGHEMVMT